MANTCNCCSLTELRSPSNEGFEISNLSKSEIGKLTNITIAILSRLSARNIKPLMDLVDPSSCLAQIIPSSIPKNRLNYKMLKVNGFLVNKTEKIIRAKLTYEAFASNLVDFYFIDFMKRKKVYKIVNTNIYLNFLNQPGWKLINWMVAPIKILVIILQIIVFPINLVWGVLVFIYQGFAKLIKNIQKLFKR